MSDTLLLLFQEDVVGTYTNTETVIELSSVTRLDGLVPLNLNLYDRNYGTPIDAYKAGFFEVLRVTSVDTGTKEITVTRAQEGTTALTIGAGNWVVYNAVNPKTITDKEDADATILKEADIVDVLTSTSVVDPLSANQGKTLQDTKANLAGDSNQAFSVAKATSRDHSPRLQQINQAVVLPEGSGATDDFRWYRVVQIGRANRSSLSLSVIGSNRILGGGVNDEIYISVENFTNDDPGIKFYTKNLTVGGNNGRAVVTNDGTNIGVYVRVGRYGPATVSEQHYWIGSDVLGILEATEIGQGTGVPASISADVVLDTNVDSPNASMSVGSIDAPNKAELTGGNTWSGDQDFEGVTRIGTSDLGSFGIKVNNVDRMVWDNEGNAVMGDDKRLTVRELRGQRITIGDDNFATIVPTHAYGIMMIGTWVASSVAATGLILFRTGSSEFANILTQQGTKIETSTGVPTGTTGTDGKVTIFSDGSGNLYIENRMGANMYPLIHLFTA